MKFKNRRFILTWKPTRLLIDWLKGIHFIKHDSVSLYKVLQVFLKNLEKDEILDRANGVAFNFIMAIFPGIIFLFTLIPYVSTFFPTINQEKLVEFLGELMPPSMFEVVSTTVLDIVSIQRGGLLTFGFLFSLYLATNGMMSLMRAFNACYKTIENRGAIKMRIIATGLTVNLAAVLFLAVILLVVGEFGLDYVMGHLAEYNSMNLSDFTVFLILFLRFLVIFIVFFLSIATIYYFGPAIHYNWRFFSIGSFISTLLCLAVSYGFSYYIGNFGTYNKVYGSIGVLIALMIWIQLLTVVLMVGYEINASLHDAVRTENLLKAKKLSHEIT